MMYRESSSTAWIQLSQGPALFRRGAIANPSINLLHLLAGLLREKTLPRLLKNLKWTDYARPAFPVCGLRYLLQFYILFHCHMFPWIIDPESVPKSKWQLPSLSMRSEPATRVHWLVEESGVHRRPDPRVLWPAEPTEAAASSTCTSAATSSAATTVSKDKVWCSFLLILLHVCLCVEMIFPRVQFRVAADNEDYGVINMELFDEVRNMFVFIRIILWRLRLFPELQPTLQRSPPGKTSRVSLTRAPSSTGSSPSSCCRAATLRGLTEQGVSRSTDPSLRTRTFWSSTHHPDSSPWPTPGQTPTEPSSSSPPSRLLGWTTSMWYSDALTTRRALTLSNGWDL